MQSFGVGVDRTEDVVVLRNGDLFVSDNKRGAVLVNGVSGQSSEPCKFTDAGYSFDTQQSNGIFVDENETKLLVADVYGGAIYECDLKTKKTSLRYQHSSMVNSVAEDSHGNLYFTQSAFGFGPNTLYGSLFVPNTSGSVWVLRNGEQKASVLVDGMVFANGITLVERE